MHVCERSLLSGHLKAECNYGQSMDVDGSPKVSRKGKDPADSDAVETVRCDLCEEQLQEEMLHVRRDLVFTEAIYSPLLGWTRFLEPSQPVSRPVNFLRPLCRSPPRS